MFWLSEGGVWDPIKHFNTATFHVCPKLGPGFLTLYAVVFFVFNILRLEQNEMWTIHRAFLHNLKSHIKFWGED